MPTTTQPRMKVMYSTRPSLMSVDWKSREKHVASIALPCSNELIPVDIALLSDVIALTRCVIAVYVRSEFAGSHVASSDAARPSIECRRKSY